MTDSETTTTAAGTGPARETSRRTLMGGIVGLGVGVPLVAACGGDDASETEGEAPTTGAIASTSDIPVGSGTLYAGDKVVVTQPEEGDFKAFSAVCTHRACVVQEVVDTEIRCGCHGSIFSTVDGSVTSGPADQPLPELTVSVDGDQISVS